MSDLKPIRRCIRCYSGDLRVSAPGYVECCACGLAVGDSFLPTAVSSALIIDDPIRHLKFNPSRFLCGQQPDPASMAHATRDVRWVTCAACRVGAQSPEADEPAIVEGKPCQT